jgi:TonB-dependent SusC/RagA subfamily outer membrane receptor
LNAQAQKITVKGSIVDGTGEPLIGATVKVKGDATSGVISDMDGNFQIAVPSENSSLVITYIGMESKTIKVGKKRQFKITLTDDNTLGEVVVVGYGQQKKASVVGSIAQTDAKTLNRHAGVSSLGQALTGNLPGVVTFSSTGMPGEEDPKIVIRTQTSINGSNDPLVLVDGVERAMNTVDLSSVESISVLKDASATAVYGVKGGNGVILITTKRGKEGKAKIDVGFNATLKAPSKLLNKLNSSEIEMISISYDKSPSVFSETVKADRLNQENQFRDEQGARKAEAERQAGARAAAEAAKRAAAEQAAREAAAEQAARKAEAERQAAELKAKMDAERSTREIAAAKKEAQEASTLSSVDRMLSGGFVANRGRLPMPISGSYRVVSHFGQYNVEGLKGVTLDNKGINIQGKPGCVARSIYDGEVSAVFGYGGMWNVLVRHGAYISVYCNLKSVSVHKGQKVSTRQALGSVGSENILQFQLRKETAKLNPEAWLSR